MSKPAIAAFLVAVGAFAWFLLPAPPRPEPGSGGHASHAGDPATLTDGVVLSIDRRAGSVTLNHGPIVNLGMPGMTMGFRAGDPALLEGMKAGDKVKFRAAVVDGEFIVTRIEAAN